MADAKKIAPTKNRGSRIPADWALNDRLRKWARDKFPLISEAHVADEAENFHSYWLSEGSAKASKIDWDLAFTVWATRAFRQLLKISGVGARTASECICLQLAQLEESTPGRELAIAIAHQQRGPVELARKHGLWQAELALVDADVPVVRCGVAIDANVDVLVADDVQWYDEGSLDLLRRYLPKDDPRIARLLDEVKEKEAQGYAYEGADASFFLLAKRMLGEAPSAIEWLAEGKKRNWKYERC